MNVKQEVRLKIRQMDVDMFSNQTLWELANLFVLVDSNQEDNAKIFKARIY